MSLLCKQLSFMAAFLAVMVAQAYGLERGYASHHGLSVIEKPYDGQVAGFGGEQIAANGEDDSDNHAPITVDMDTGRTGVIASFSVEFVPVQVAEILVRDWIMLQELAQAELLKNAFLDTLKEESPPAAEQVARCVVMLI